MRTSKGCWTCRLRRKKCDEHHPVCHACAALDIKCHNDQNNKPEWMDGGLKQGEMAELVKREIKEKARRHRGERPVDIAGESMVLSREPPSNIDYQISNLLETPTDIQNDGMGLDPDASTTRLRPGTNYMHGCQDSRDGITLSRPNAVLLMFYVETLLPFLFPFYRPSHLQGGRGWVLEMMNRPAVRQAVLCQSAHFFSLSGETVADRDSDWKKVPTQTEDTFRVLRQALQLIDGPGVAEHLHGAVRILASITQVQRFEIAVLSFHNWQAHLTAAIALLKQILDPDSAVELGQSGSSFTAIMSRLGSSSASWSWSNQNDRFPSAEQAAFRFSTALVIMDDVVASTVLQEQPRLYEYHCKLLGYSEDPPLNLEAVFGLQNWTIRQLGNIAALDAWKQQRRIAGNLDVVELVYRATIIKESLLASLTRLDIGSAIIPKENGSLLDAFAPSANQSSLVTRVWAHAALIYLSIIVSGWQPASVDVHYHVSQVIELLKRQSSPALLRSVVWPFCVAGCLAEPIQEAYFRGMVEVLQPPSFFGTLHKALEIMENVWRNRCADVATRDLATCFRTQGDLVLLV